MEYNKINIDSYEIIQKLCQCIGVVDNRGNVCAHLEDNKIVSYEVSIYGEIVKHVLYDQPFDVQYANTLIKLYEKTCEYLILEDTDKEQSSDYKTAYRLELK